MTTISPNRRRGQGARLRLAVGGGAFLVLLIILLLWREPIAGLLWRVLGPLSSVRNSAAVSAGDIFGGFASKEALVAENDRLRLELASSSIAVLDRNRLYAENIALKGRLNRSVQTSSTLAAVLSHPPASPYDTLMLDVGSQSGVAVGDLVSAGGSVYIGTIVQVYPTTSRALLYSSPGQTYDAALIGSSTRQSTPISVTGQGAGSMTAQVPAGTDVSVGDEVEFPGIMPEFIARVTYIESNAQESFKTIYMQLPVDPLTLPDVEVRKPAV